MKDLNIHIEQQYVHNAVKNYFKQHKITGKKVAKALGVSQSLISLYLNGETFFSKKFAQKLHKEYGFDEYFLTEGRLEIRINQETGENIYITHSLLPLNMDTQSECDKKLTNEEIKTEIDKASKTLSELQRKYKEAENILYEANRTISFVENSIRRLKQLALNESEIVSEDSCVISVEEILSGIFTVNNSGKKVKFAPGNLYWNGKKFAFEKHQYDYPTTWDPNHVGHLFWSKDAAIAVAEKYNAGNRTENDSFFATDGGAIKGWTILSRNEWKYLMTHSLAKNSRNGYDFVIAGKFCAILLPDNLQSNILQDNYTEAEWIEAESEYGLVALPFAGSRIDSDFYDNSLYSSCWSSTPYGSDEDYAWSANFCNYAMSTNFDYRSGGSSVRLVSVQ